MVADTDVESLVAIGKALSSFGYDGLPVLGCAAAREMARRSGKLAIAIACAALPDGSGVELLAELQRDYQCRTAVLSSDPEPDGGCPVGVDLWLHQPLDHAALRQAIRALGRMSGRDAVPESD